MIAPTWKKQKALKDSLAASDEAGLRAAKQLKLRHRRIAALMGKKAPPDERGNEHADQVIFSTLVAALRSGSTVRMTGRRGPGVLSVGDPSKDFKSGHDGHDEALDMVSLTINVPLWKHTGDKLKTLAWIMSLADVGDRAKAFNLNLGADVVAMAGRAQERRNIGLARFVRDRLQKHLSRASNGETPDFFFWIEANQSGSAHLHGVIVFPEAATQPTVKAMLTAMKKAGGTWRASDTGRQLRLKSIFDAAGWASYVSKWQHLTRLRIQIDNTVAASNGVRSAAARWYVEARRSEAPIQTVRP